MYICTICLAAGTGGRSPVASAPTLGAAAAGPPPRWPSWPGKKPRLQGIYGLPDWGSFWVGYIGLVYLGRRSRVVITRP